MFDWLLEKDDQQEEEEEEEEEEPLEEEETEAEEQIDELTVYYNWEISECFSLFDKNKTGNMETSYLQRALNCLGIFLTEEEMQDVTEELDTNGFVTFEKFRAYAYDTMSSTDPTEALKIAFQAFDPDREGIVASDRLKKWMTSLGDPLTEKEAKELVKMGDPAGRGIISYDELVMALLRK